MKKSTQQKIMVGFIIFTFTMSSIAFFFTSFGQQPEEFKPLENFVIDGELDPRTEAVYAQNGFTSLKFFYSDNSLIDYMDQLPEATRTNLNQIQLIVQKIPANETFLTVYNRNGREDVMNLTKGVIVSALCRLLTVPPLECSFVNRTG